MSDHRHATQQDLSESEAYRKQLGFIFLRFNGVGVSTANKEW
jgi:hypothetical protein